MYRIFISHSTVDLDYVERMANELSRLRLPSFVAARDIPRTTEWLPKIEAALRQCDALIALLSPSFRASEWADQEVGFALGMGKRVIPLRRSNHDPRPYGFLGKFQAIDAGSWGPPDVASAVFESLLEHEAERSKLVDIIIESIQTERDHHRLRQWIDRLPKVKDQIDAVRSERLAACLERNAVLRLDGHARAIVIGVIGTRS